MARFQYKAVKETGDLVEGVLEAVDRKTAVDMIHAQGLFPIMAESSGSSAQIGRSKLGLFRRRRVTNKDLVLLTHELATLLHAGLPLDRSLTILVQLARTEKVRQVVDSLLEMVRGGKSFADALESFPEEFPAYYTGLVRSGEASGNLDGILTRLAASLERAFHLREETRSSLYYPVLVAILALLTLVVLLVLVVPQFQALFEDAQAELPLLTQAVIGISGFMTDFWWALALAILVLATLAYNFRKSEKGRLKWDAWVLKMPLYGPLVTKLEVARLTRNLGTLMEGGVNILKAINLTMETLDNMAIVQALGTARDQLKVGKGLSDPLAETNFFPILSIQLLRVGEESGQLEMMLLKVADIYEEESRRDIKRFVSLLVPALTIALGVMVAIIIGAILMAILSAYNIPL